MSNAETRRHFVEVDDDIHLYAFNHLATKLLTDNGQ